jgi:hypothetical protein
MIAKLAYLTSPSPDRYLLNFQSSHGVNFEVEISEGHLANIIADGAHYAFRKQYPHRVPVSTATESAENVERATGRT